MIFSVSKSFLYLSLGLPFAVADVPASKRHPARFDESGLTSNSTTHGYAHSLGEVRPVKEGVETASDPAAHGHLYTPGMNRPVSAHPTESTPDSTTESMILAPRITTTETIFTSIPLVTKTITITRPYSQSGPAPTPLASTAVAAPEVSGLPDYRSITITLTQQSAVRPPTESATPEPTTTYSLTGSSPGSLWHVHAATTSQPPPWTGNSTPCAGNASFECVVNGSSIITLGPISQLLGTGAHSTSGAGTSGTGNHSHDWTSNSAPCAQNNSFECVVEGSSTITLGLISEILGATTRNPTSSIAVSSSGNHSQNWTSHSTPCVDNKSFECVDTGSGIITLGPIASLNHLRPRTADSSPCVQNNSFECVINGSSTITLGLIASLTASQPSTISTGKGLLSTLLSSLDSILANNPPKTSTASTKLPIALSTTSSTSSSGELPQSAAPSMMGGPTPCASNTSLECLVQGTSTFVVETLGLPAQTPTPVSRTLIPCAQNTTLSCLVDGSHTLTVPIMPSIGLVPCPQDTLSSCVVAGSHTLTVPPRPSNITISSSFSTASGTQNPHDPYPYPRASNGGRKANVPKFLLLLCSLVSIVTAQGFYARSKGVDPSSTSTNINYSPLVSSLNGLASSVAGAPDGNWGIGAPPATTPAPSPLSPYGGGGTAASIATGFTAPQNPTFAGGGGVTNTTTASTHADSGSSSSSSSEFPSNFIVPVTGSGTEAPVETSAQPVASKNVTSRASNLKLPLLLLLICSLVSLVVATMTPAPLGVSLPSLCPDQTDMSSCEVVDGITMTWSHPELASSDLNTSAPPSTPVITSHRISFPSSLYSSTNHNPTTTSTTKTATASQGPAARSCASNTTFTAGTPALQTTLKTTTSSPPTVSKSATSESSKMKIPFFLILLTHWASLTAGAITNPSPSGLMGSVFTFASAPTPTSLSSSIQTKPTMAITTEIPISSGQQSLLVTLSGAGSCPFGTAGPGCVVQGSGSNGASALPSGPTPNVCPSNTDLMCIVQGSNTFTVGTLGPQTTPTTTSAMVAATTGLLTASPSKPAKSGASANIKLPLFLSLIGTLVSRVMSAAASDFPIPSDYVGAGRMRYHPEPTSQGMRSITTPFLVVFLCGAIATLYSLSTGRKKVKLVEKIGDDSGKAVQRGECVQTVAEGEKVH